MDLAAVLVALTDAAATATDGFRKITAHDYVPDAVEAPCIFPSDVAITFDVTMKRGTDRLVVSLRFLCSRTDDREGQHQLFPYLSGSGPASLKAALEAARGAPGVAALGGACDDFHVQSIAGFRWYEHPAGSQTYYVGADITILVIGPGED